MYAVTTLVFFLLLSLAQAQDKFQKCCGDRKLYHKGKFPTLICVVCPDKSYYYSRRVLLPADPGPVRPGRVAGDGEGRGGGGVQADSMRVPHTGQP